MNDSQKTEQTRRVVRAIHAASASGDLEKERQLFSPDLVIEEPPYLPYGGTYHGYDGFLQLAKSAIQFGLGRALPNFLVRRCTGKGNEKQGCGLNKEG
jgi:hypothetical protein